MPGTCYLYEISVRHCDVRGIPGCITAEVLLLLYAASPIKGSKSKGSNICVISQVDSRANGSAWLVGGGDIGAPAKEDLLRELKAAGSLRNILDEDGGETGGAADGTSGSRGICLDDFEFLCVLGRGGFGKVMQVRSKQSQKIFAMKILKKSELQRRRQVERTQTEMKILAAVKHPFVVQMHYAFQNENKLFMVMDFVQGGDFFTLMRKFRRLPEDWCRVYIAEIGMALQHLHDMEIVYRDLKPGTWFII
jgi:serine/threonine protein kinase